MNIPFTFQNKSVVMKSVKLICLSALLLCSMTVSATVILPGMMDDFENGTTDSWVRGPLGGSNLAPINLANVDESNRYLKVQSYGGEPNQEAGSRMVFFNENQWAGDYSAIGSISISMKAESLTEESLYMRLAIYDMATSGVYSRYVSSDAQQLKADGEWHIITLSLLAEDLTRFRGEESATDVLTNVSHLRILSSQDNISGWGVDKISATLSLDNITAVSIPETVSQVPVPASIWLMLSGLLALTRMSLQKKVTCELSNRVD